MTYARTTERLTRATRSAPSDAFRGGHTPRWNLSRRRANRFALAALALGIGALGWMLLSVGFAAFGGGL